MKNQNLKSEITGRVWKIVRAAGSMVVEGDEVMIIESMKMEIPVLAPFSGELVETCVDENEEVVEGQVLAVMRG